MQNVATLSTVDGNYRYGAQPMTVNTSSGWVSLGDGGSLTASTVPVDLSFFPTLYLMVGEVGKQVELADATVTITIRGRIFWPPSP
jgi:hypothetical protein